MQGFSAAKTEPIRPRKIPSVHEDDTMTRPGRWYEGELSRPLEGRSTAQRVTATADLHRDTTPTTSSSTTTTTMASALLRRQLILPKRTTFRTFSTSPARWKPEVQSTNGAKNPLETHTVEDLHGMSAAEILAETGTRADTKLRHFTGAFVSSFVPFLM